MGPTLSTPRGDKYYNQYRPPCEVCPRDRGKVVGTLQGYTGWGKEKRSYTSLDYTGWGKGKKVLYFIRLHWMGTGEKGLILHLITLDGEKRKRSYTSLDYTGWGKEKRSYTSLDYTGWGKEKRSYTLYFIRLHWMEKEKRSKPSSKI